MLANGKYPMNVNYDYDLVQAIVNFWLELYLIFVIGILATSSPPVASFHF